MNDDARTLPNPRRPLRVHPGVVEAAVVEGHGTAHAIAIVEADANLGKLYLELNDLDLGFAEGVHWTVTVRR